MSCFPHIFCYHNTYTPHPVLYITGPPPTYNNYHRTLVSNLNFTNAVLTYLTYCTNLLFVLSLSLLLSANLRNKSKRVPGLHLFVLVSLTFHLKSNIQSIRKVVQPK